MIFEPFSAERCCLCGSAENLTGEHKIKASALRTVFGGKPMVIGHLDGETDLREAQGPKSPKFHFKARVCSACNSTRTQAADREFDRFNREALRLFLAQKDPADLMRLERYKIGGDPYLNLFRYFAKLLSCHLAESEGPRFIDIVEFAIGQSDINPIKLYTDADPNYINFSNYMGDLDFASHGGLTVYFDQERRLPESFSSSLTIGPLRYVFSVEFGFLIGLTLKDYHRKFFEKCEKAFDEAVTKSAVDSANPEEGA